MLLFIFSLLGQMNAPMDLGLDVAKGTVHTEGSVKKIKFLSPIISPGYWTVNAFQVYMLISSFIIDHLFQTVSSTTGCKTSTALGFLE